MPPGLPGRHNLLNAAAALTAVGAAGLDVQQAALAVASFKSLPHRLQVLGQRQGVTYINDSIASTPVATVAALEALQDRPIVLILGGMDRGLDWSRYAAAFVQASLRAVIGLPANGPRIIATLRQAGIAPASGFHEVVDLPSAVALARELATAGDTVLLSPGAPSFPQFIDFRDRGQAFARVCGFAEIVE
jgi:UDP-N-acetylmuramoylalanine--D-glutamate ligase